MLILGAKRLESFTITVPKSDKDTVLEITISDIRSGLVRFGFEAPEEVDILRNKGAKPNTPAVSR